MESNLQYCSLLVWLQDLCNHFSGTISSAFSFRFALAILYISSLLICISHKNLFASLLYLIVSQSRTLNDAWDHSAHFGVSILIKRIQEFLKSNFKSFGKYKSISIVVGVNGVTLLNISEFFSHIFRVSPSQE
jgi:hypothetical protein